MTRYRISLEQRLYASTTINLRLAAVRLTYEAADCGLLSADLATGIRRVKGAKRLGVPVGNWLTTEQGKRLLLTAGGTSLRSKCDDAILAILMGCGLRRAELTALRVEDIQLREEHWVIADPVGKGVWDRLRRRSNRLRYVHRKSFRVGCSLDDPFRPVPRQAPVSFRPANQAAANLIGSIWPF